ncbi:MAG: hypothetical protein J1F32_00705 [Erysipelotrichales bacterium]|nr:hypothetical protein [Erysipelotrichales bacterium]
MENDIIVRNYRKNRFLNAVQQSIYDSIYLSINSRRPNCVIPVDFQSFADIEVAMTAVKYDHPEIMNVNFNNFNASIDVRGRIINLSYIRTPEQSKINEVVNYIKEKTSSLKKDYDKALFIHDYLVENVSYDYAVLKKANDGEITSEEDLECFSIYGPLVHHRAVCSGFTLAYNYLLSQIGIDAVTILANEDKNVPHCFSAIHLKDEENGWINVDLTIDSKKENIFFDRGKKRIYPFFHFAFGVSDERMRDLDVSSNEFLGCDNENLSYYYQNNLFFNQFPKLRRYINDMSGRKKIFIFEYKGNYKAKEMAIMASKLLYEHGINIESNYYFFDRYFCFMGGTLNEF